MFLDVFGEPREMIQRRSADAYKLVSLFQTAGGGGTVRHYLRDQNRFRRKNFDLAQSFSLPKLRCLLLGTWVELHHFRLAIDLAFRLDMNGVTFAPDDSPGNAIAHAGELVDRKAIDFQHFVPRTQPGFISGSI